MTHFYGLADMDAVREGDPWAITRLGNKVTFSVDEIRLLHSVRDRLYTYWCDAGEGCEFLAANDGVAIQWINETFTGSPSDYLIEQVTRTETRREVKV